MLGQAPGDLFVVRWIATCTLEFPSHRKALRSVELKQFGCCAPNRCQSNDTRTINMKMLGPDIVSRMKEQNNAAGNRIHRGKVRALSSVAVEASQREVFQRGQSAVLGRNNVIRFMKPEVSFRE